MLDQQIRKHGRPKKAVEETIRICKDEGVLKEYLEGREKEVIDIMITLFGQEYAVEAYAEEKSKAGEARGKAIGKIEGAISTYYEDFHFSPMEIIGKIRERFSLDEDDAKTYVEETLGVKLNQSTLVMAEESIPFQKN